MILININIQTPEFKPDIYADKRVTKLIGWDSDKIMKNILHIEI